MDFLTMTLLSVWAALVFHLEIEKVNGNEYGVVSIVAPRINSAEESRKGERHVAVHSNRCGAVGISAPRINFGEESRKGEWPFVVALYSFKQSNYFCGGSIISNNVVLTAAHCMQAKSSARIRKPDDIKVLLGAYNITEENEFGAEQRLVVEILIHPDWDTNVERFGADIAILVLNESVTFTNYIRKVCLPADDARSEGASGFIVGWGLAQNSTGANEAILRHASTNVLVLSSCFMKNPHLSFISAEHMFCGGGGEATPNRGDSGGGFFVNSSSVWVQIGIISSLHLGETTMSSHVAANLSALYTDVKDYKNWIVEKIEQFAAYSSTKINLHCNYRHYFKMCSIYDLEVRQENLVAISFTGANRAGSTDPDVELLQFSNGTMLYLPNGIGTIFKNLKELRLGICEQSLEQSSLSTTSIKRSNFKNMENLVKLSICDNDIGSLEENCLWDLPNLQYFTLSRTKLKTIREKTFEKNEDLMEVDLSSNQLEFLPNNLFLYNSLLEKVSFKNNSLKKIEINFNALKKMYFLDLTENGCVNALHHSRRVSLREIQNVINSNCNNE